MLEFTEIALLPLLISTNLSLITSASSSGPLNKEPSFRSCFLLDMWSWATYFSGLYLGFLLSNTGIIIVPTS